MNNANLKIRRQQDSCGENFNCLHHLHLWRATCMYHTWRVTNVSHTCDYCRNSIISWLSHTRISVANYEHLLCCNSLLSFCSKFKDHWKVMDPHDPGISKNKPFKKGEQNFYLAVVLCRATSLSLLMNWQLLSCCVFTCSLSRNCWDTLLSSCPPNVGVQDLVS